MHHVDQAAFASQALQRYSWPWTLGALVALAQVAKGAGQRRKGFVKGLCVPGLEPLQGLRPGACLGAQG